MSRRVAVGLAWAALCAVASGCISEEGLDPDKPLPGPIPSGGQPAPTCGLSELTQGDQALYLHVIDVGQGDALLIQTPDDGIDGNGVAEGYNILIDAGNLGTLELTDGGQYVVDYLRRLGVRRLDYAVITHAHADHYGGMLKVFDVLDVVNIVDPGHDVENTTWQQFLGAAEDEATANGGAFIRPAVGGWVAAAGDRVDWGDELEVEVLSARAVADLGRSDNTKVNNTSIVLRITYGSLSMLLMGDAEAEVEAQLLASGRDLSANILKVGHHGSSTSSSTAFLTAVFRDAAEDQRFGAISSGRVSFSGVQLPTVQTQSRLRDVLDTTHLFSTEHGDDEKTEEEAPGDDHITFVLTPEGEIGACYVF